MHCVVTTQGVAVVGTLVRSNGLAGLNFPLRVSVARNTIREIGVYGKQVTGVYVSVAGFVDVTDNVIGGSPSSGIKVDDFYRRPSLPVQSRLRYDARDDGHGCREHPQSRSILCER